LDFEKKSRGADTLTFRYSRPEQQRPVDWTLKKKVADGADTLKFRYSRPEQQRPVDRTLKKKNSTPPIPSCSRPGQNRPVAEAKKKGKRKEKSGKKIPNFSSAHSADDLSS
jgi:hypothetical protein